MLAHMWQLQGITQLGASRAALLFKLLPVWTLLLTALGGDRILPAQFSGMVLVLAGASRASARREARRSSGRALERAI